MKKTIIIMASTLLLGVSCDKTHVQQAQTPVTAGISELDREIRRVMEKGINLEERQRQVPAIAVAFSRRTDPARARWLRLVLDAIPVRVHWKDCNSVYLGCNRRFAEQQKLNYSCPFVYTWDGSKFVFEADVNVDVLKRQVEQDLSRIPRQMQVLRQELLQQ